MVVTVNGTMYPVTSVTNNSLRSHEAT